MHFIFIFIIKINYSSSPLLYFNSPNIRKFTTRKPEKSNGITDRIFPSIIYTDGNNSVSKSVGTYVGIYRRNISIGIYQRFRRWSIQFVWNIRNGMVMSGDFTDGNYRGIQTEIAIQWRGAFTDGITDGSNQSVIPSEKTIICTHLPTLSSSVSPSSSFPSHLSPPKLQPNTHLKLSTILNTSTQVSYILYVVTISVSCRFYHFFVSKSILFSFNI